MTQTERSSRQKFTIATMNRSQLTECPYNPRRIDEIAKRRLRNNLKTVGLLRPLVFNKTTGRLISGHQRLAVMDALERRKDYELEIAVVELDEKAEKEQVVFFNNPLTMGEYDIDALERLLPTVDVEACGFDKGDLQVMLRGWETPMQELEREQFQQVAEVVEDIKAANKLKREEKKKAHEKFHALAAQIKGNMTGKSPEATDMEYFTVLMFATPAARDEFLDRLNLPKAERYISGEMVRQLVAKAVFNG